MQAELELEAILLEQTRSLADLQAAREGMASLIGVPTGELDELAMPYYEPQKPETISLKDSYPELKQVEAEEQRARVADAKIFAPYMGISDRVRALIDDCEAAVETRTVLSFDYRDESGSATNRDV